MNKIIYILTIFCILCACNRAKSSISNNSPKDTLRTYWIESLDLEHVGIIDPYGDNEHIDWDTLNHFADKLFGLLERHPELEKDSNAIKAIHNLDLASGHIPANDTCVEIHLLW